MPGSAQSAGSGHRRKLHKRPASSHLRGDADQAREGPWRVRARLVKSDLALAGYAKCNGRQCKVQDLDRGRKALPPGGLFGAPKKSCQECLGFRFGTPPSSGRGQPGPTPDKATLKPTDSRWKSGSNIQHPASHIQTRTPLHGAKAAGKRFG